VLIDRESLPRNAKWIAVFLVGTVAAIVVYGIASAGQPRWPGGSSPVGLAYGILGGSIMLFEFLLWPRKKVRAWRIGSARAWMRAHIWLGFLTVPLIVLHGGFTSGGQLSAVLMALFAVVIVSGIFGLVLQQYLPRMMLERVPAETIYSQIDYVAEQSYWNAEDLIEATFGEPIGPERSLRPRQQADESAPAFVTVGAVRSVGSVRGKVLETQVPAAATIGGDMLVDGFLKEIGPYLLQGRGAPGTPGRGSPLRLPSSSAAFFSGLRGSCGPEAGGIVDALESLCDQRRQYDLQIRMHGWLHGWLCVHVPLSVALIGLMFVHIVVALKYW
jgi:hypothetical protein